MPIKPETPAQEDVKASRGLEESQRTAALLHEAEARRLGAQAGQQTSFAGRTGHNMRLAAKAPTADLLKLRSYCD